MVLERLVLRIRGQRWLGLTHIKQAAAVVTCASRGLGPLEGLDSVPMPLFVWVNWYQ